MKRTTASLIALFALLLALSVAAVVSPPQRLHFTVRRPLLPAAMAAPQNISNTSSDSSYPMIGIDSGGAATVVWLELQSAYQIYSNTNKSGAWGSPAKAATYTYFGSDIDGHKGFAVGPTGSSHLAYRDADAQLTNYEIFHSLYSGGWGAASDIALTGGASTAPAVAVNPVDNSALVVWMDGTRTEWEIFSRTRSASGTWSAVAPIEVASGYFPDVAIDSSGQAHLTWSRRSGGTSSVLYSRSSNPQSGTSWTTPIVVKGDTREDWCFPKIDCDGSGSAVIAWIDGNPGNDEIFARRIYADGSMSAEANISESTASSLECDVAVHRPSGTIQVVWAEAGEILLRSHDTAWSAITNVSASAAASAAPSVAVDSAGKVHVVWQESSGGNLEIFYQSSGTSTTTTTRTTVSSTTSVQIVKAQPPVGLNTDTALDPSRASKSVLLSWQRNPGNAKIPLANHRIWRKRADQADIDFRPIGLASGEAVSYLDGPLPLDQRFAYALTAIPLDPAGVESDGSDIAVEATSFPPLDAALQTVTNSSLFRDEKINILTWTNSPLNATVRIVQFNIYRRQAGDNGAAFQRIASVAGTVSEYRDRKMSVDKYQYVVTAVDTGGMESIYSAVVGEQ
jgi:hypothetical protein